MRNVHVVCYDIADAKRLRQTYRTMKGFGDPLQYSVFRCELSDVELIALKEKLWSIMNLAEDRVIVIDLGPAGARGDQCIESWGTQRSEPPSRTAKIV
jgi:CRISPR-associated protein Cas2